MYWIAVLSGVVAAIGLIAIGSGFIIDRNINNRPGGAMIAIYGYWICAVASILSLLNSVATVLSN